MNKRQPVFLFLTALPLFFTSDLSADIIHLKNKQNIECVIEKEDEKTIEVRLNYGTVTFKRSEVDRIERSDPLDTQNLWKKWNEEKKDQEKRRPEEAKILAARDKERLRLVNEESTRRALKAETALQTITVAADNGQIIMNTLLNSKVRVRLVLDSGASVVLLSKKTAESLGIDLSKLRKGHTQVADGRTVDTAFTILESVKVQDLSVTDTESTEGPGIEAKNIEACIILEDSGEPGKEAVKAAMPDGLLGMSFLKNFKLSANYKEGKISFEKLKSAEV